MLKILAWARQSRRSMALLIAAAVAFCGLAGGTVAFIMARTAPVTNVFTMEGISVSLMETLNGETSNTYPMTPGALITKDPQVTVRKGSMAAWLFVKLEKSENFDDFLAFAVADGWTVLEGEENIFYRAAETSQEDQLFYVIKDNQVQVKDEVTVVMLRALTEETFPTLTVTAYAAQMSGIETPAQAWAILSGGTENP